MRSGWWLQLFPRKLRHTIAWLILGWLILKTLAKLLWWLIRVPARAGILACLIAGLVQWGIVGGLVSASSAMVLFTLVWVALVAERGTAQGFSAILTGVSRLIKVRRIWPDVMSRVGMVDKLSAKPLRMHRPRITQRGLELDLYMGQMGRHESAIHKLLPDIQSAMYVDRVRAIPTDQSGVVRLAIEWGLHLRKHLALSDIPASTREGYLCIGITEDGAPFELPIGLSVLAGGLTGMGKSSFVWAIIYSLIKSGIPFRLRIIDPKHTEWSIAREHVDDSPIVYRYTSSPMDYGDRGLTKGGFLWEIEQDLTERLKNIPVGERVHRPTDDEPLDITIIDETLPLAENLRKKKEAHPLAVTTYKGRAGCHWNIFLSQVGEKEVLGPVRDMVPVRLCFKSPTWEFTDMVLGSGATARGAAAHTLDPVEDRGVCYVARDNGSMYAARIGYATDADTEYLIMGDLPPVVMPRDPHADRPCSVYRYYAVDGELLYVGKAFDPVKRAAEHARDEPWYALEVDESQTTWEWWPTEAAALFEERKQIKRDHPKHNKQHNGAHYRGAGV